MSDINKLNDHYHKGYHAGENGHAYNIEAGMSKSDREHYAAGFNDARDKKLGDKIKAMRKDYP